MLKIFRANRLRPRRATDVGNASAIYATYHLCRSTVAKQPASARMGRLGPGRYFPSFHRIFTPEKVPGNEGRRAARFEAARKDTAVPNHNRNGGLTGSPDGKWDCSNSTLRREGGFHSGFTVEGLSRLGFQSRK